MAQFTIYKSADSGAPVLTGQNSALINVLDGVLVNGYTASVTSITRAGATATVTTATNHGLNTGNSTTIAGANEGDYNGTFVVTVTGLTTFTYTVPGAPASPATGTITWKKLAAGWTRDFTGTNKAVYRPPSGNRMYLRVLDDGSRSNTAEAQITGYETMSDVDTGINPFPTGAQSPGGVIPGTPVRKSTTTDATPRPWVVAADERTLYFFAQTGDFGVVYYGWMFGEIFSFKASDPYRTIILGRVAFNTGTSTNESMGQMSSTINSAAANFWIARGHTETVGSVNIGRHGDAGKRGTTHIRSMAGDIPYTNPEDGKIYCAQVWVHDPTTIPSPGLRGRMRGFYHWVHPITSVADGDTFSGEASGEYTGKTFMLIKSTCNGAGTGLEDGLFVIETSNTLETN